VVLYPAKLSLKIDGGIKIFHNKQKLKQYMTIKSALQKILQGILQIEDEKKHDHGRTGSIKPDEKNRQALSIAINWLHALKSLNNKNN
jgi:hypothetical protein